MTTLRGDPTERWRELCERAVVEQDPDKFVATVQKLLQVLEEREEATAHRDRVCLPPIDRTLSTRISQGGFLRRVVFVLFIHCRNVVSGPTFH